MRVALFTNNFHPRLSGVSVAVKFLDAALKEHGHQTLVIAPNYGFGHKVKGVEVFRVKSLYLRPMRMSLPIQTFDQSSIKEVLINFQPDLIHSQHPFLLGKSALDLADELGLPLVYTFHTLYEFFTHYFMVDSDTVRKQVREYVIKYANHCDLVIAPTEPIRKYLVEIGVTTRSETVPTGVDFSRFKKVAPEEIDELRRNYGLERFERVLLSVGRISKEKNVRLGLLALAELTRRGRNYALLMFGDGPEIGELEREAEKLGVSDRLIMGGFLDQDQLAAAYFLGDVFLFPSLSDTQGIVLYEARAAGLPVVATDSMASRAAVEPGQNGLFASNEPADYAARIDEVFADRARFSARFDTHAFSHEAIGATYDRLYRETVAKGRSPNREASRKLSRLIDELIEMMVS
jgi:1,2-diacylglycerol 3-alpha-glucosyltransferase